MPAYFSPCGNDQQSDANGDPVSGALIFTYQAGTTTPVVTYSDAAGTIPQSNPVECNSAGYPASPIYLPAGQAVKMVFTTSVASGSVAYRPTVDNIQGVNDPAFSATVSEWQPFSGTPTYISATSFSVSGDQTLELLVNRRTKTTNTGGTAYSTISASAYNAGAGLTTVTVVNDSTPLDSGLSAVSVGILNPTNPSVPKLSATYFTANTSKILGRVTAGSGAVEELTAAQALSILGIPAVPRSYLAGLTLSTAGSSATFAVAAGEAANSTNAVLMQLAASISKTTSAWAVGTGNGGLDTGTIANSTWYHAYLIRRTDTGVVDVIFSTSASAPTLPTNYTQYRRIGSMRTNGSAQWTKFIQFGDKFLWDAAVPDYNTNAPTSATSLTTTVPTGVQVEGIYVVGGSPGAGIYVCVSSLSVAVASPVATQNDWLGSSAYSSSTEKRITTNTSGQIRIQGSSANNLWINTYGWIDSRGKDA